MVLLLSSKPLEKTQFEVNVIYKLRNTHGDQSSLNVTNKEWAYLKRVDTLEIQTIFRSS